MQKQEFEVRKLIEVWPHTKRTEHVIFLEGRSTAERYVIEQNKRLNRLGKQPVSVDRNNPEKEVYYCRPWQRAPKRRRR